MEIKNIIAFYGDEPRIGTYVLAQGFEKRHKKVLELIHKYQTLFEKSSPLKGHKCKSTGGRPVTEYLLNEKQATFLGTLFRNNPQTVIFKENLVEEFYRMKNVIRRVKAQADDPEWLATRVAGKIPRLDSTDTMKIFVEYAISQGSIHSDKYYTNLTRMANGALFITEGKFQNLRNVMTSRQLMIIGAADGIINKALADGMKHKMFYKDIYALAKNRVLQFAELHGQTKIISSQLEKINE